MVQPVDFSMHSGTLAARVLSRRPSGVGDTRTRRSSAGERVRSTSPAASMRLSSGVNPEQLFAAGYSACFIGAMKFVAGQRKMALPADTAIEATVGIGQIAAGFGIEVQMVVNVPGLDRAVAQAIVNKAHEVCPYSNATRGNIEVTITLA